MPRSDSCRGRTRAAVPLHRQEHEPGRASVYPAATLRKQLGKFVELADLRNEQAAARAQPHPQQLDLVGQLIDTRKQAFEARTGREMTDENIWLAERHEEQRALGKIIAAVSDPQAEAQAVHGAGTRGHS